MLVTQASGEGEQIARAELVQQAVLWADLDLPIPPVSTMDATGTGTGAFIGPRFYTALRVAVGFIAMLLAHKGG